MPILGLPTAAGSKGFGMLGSLLYDRIRMGFGKRPVIFNLEHTACFYGGLTRPNRLIFAAPQTDTPLQELLIACWYATHIFFANRDTSKILKELSHYHPYHVSRLPRISPLHIPHCT